MELIDDSVSDFEVIFKGPKESKSISHPAALRYISIKLNPSIGLILVTLFDILTHESTVW